MNPYLIIVVMAGYIVVGIGGFKLGVDHEVASQAREQKHITEAVEAASSAAAQAIANIKIVNKTIQNEVQREIQNNVVYRDCKHTPDGLRLLNQAITGDKPPGDSKLPKADATGR